MRPLAGSDPAEIGPYRLLARLDAGSGPGRLYLSRAANGRPIAVEIVHRDAGPELRDGIRRRARLRTPFALPVVDYSPDSDPPWLAYEYVPAPTLREMVDDHGPLPERTVLGLAAGLAGALDAMHRAGLAGGLSAQNVLLTPDGPRLVGLAGHAASDVHSLGELLLFAATGSLSPGHADVPPRVGNLIRRCMASEPERRPAPAEILGETGAFLDGRWLPGAVHDVIEARRREVDGLTSPSWSATETLDAPRTDFTWQRAHFRALPLLAVLLLCAALLVRAGPTPPAEIALPGSVEIEGLQSAKQILPSADLVYVLGTSGSDDRVVALDAGTGQQRWSRAVTAPSRSVHLEHVGGILLVMDAGAGRPGLLTLSARTGRRITSIDSSTDQYCVSMLPRVGLAIVGMSGLRNTIDAATGFVQRTDNRYLGTCPIVTKDRLYTFHAGTLHADPSLNEAGWEINVPEPPISGENWTVTDDTLFVVGEEPSAPALRAYSKDGKRLWASPLPFTRGVPGLPTGLLLAGRMVVVGAENGIHAFDTATGRPRWHAPTVIPEIAPSLAGPVVLATSGLPNSETMLHGLDLNSGRVRWQVTLERDTFVGAVDAHGIYTTAVSSPWHRVREEHLTALDPTTGRERWRLDTGVQQLAVADGRLYAMTGNRLLILNPATGKSAAVRSVTANESKGTRRS